MLYISLLASAALLIAANWAVRSRRHPVGGTLLLCAGFTALPVLTMCFLPAVLLQAFGLVFALMVSGIPRRSPRVFGSLSGAATLAAYGVVGWYVWAEQREYASLREDFPYESMEERVPPPKAFSRPADLPAVCSQHLDRLEVRLTGEQDDFHAGMLRRLHEQTVNDFVNNPGFGVARMPPRPSRQWLNEELRKPEPPIRQPGSPLPIDASPGQLEASPPPGEEGPLRDLHEDSVLDFVYPRGFGYVKDRRHVAGFRPHQFWQVPEAMRWRVRTIDLVSLLLHYPPVAYVSANLPRMDELRQAPTRPLDVFESAGLARLGAGEGLFIHATDRGVRMLGALRATRQCLACHGCERGDLLGAFSYTLQQE
jgi:hypothetical protein